MKKTLLALSLLALAGCDVNDADVVSRNLGTDAANFKVERRIVFYNIRTGEYILSVEGLCARENVSSEIQITCQTGPNEYQKHFMGLNPEVTYFVQHMEPNKANKYMYTVTFKPTAIIPNVELR